MRLVSTVKIAPVLSPRLFFGKVNQGQSVIWLFLEINLSKTISMEMSCRDLSIDMAIKIGTFKIKKMRFPVLPSYLKTPFYSFFNEEFLMKIRPYSLENTNGTSGKTLSRSDWVPLLNTME